MSRIIRLTRDNASRSPVWINFQHVLTFEDNGTGGTVIFITADKAIKLVVTEAPATIETMLNAE